ncbi:MAG: protein translocase subunit SecD, partial [bacterium]
MHRVPPWKIILVVAVLLGSLWVLLPSFQWYSVPYESRSKRETPRLAELKLATEDPDRTSESLLEEYKTEQDRVKNLQEKAIRLGLDLQGGVHLVLDVDIEKVVEQERAKGTPERDMDYVRERTLEQATLVVRQRVDEWGVAEPLVQKIPPRQIVVELPGYNSPEQAADLLQMNAQLRFHMLADWEEASRIVEDIDAQVPVDLLGQILRTSGGGLSSEFYVKDPEDVELMKGILSRPDVQDVIPNNYAFKWSDKQEPVEGLFGDSPYRSLYLVNANPELTGESLERAYFYIDQANFNEPQVHLTFDRQGGRIFARLTRQRTGDRLAIILDEKVYCAPRIQEEITGGSAVINGINDVNEARTIAVVLNAGALPAETSIAENDVVGASLGADSIRKGVTSAIGGLIVVVIFMVVYYSLCGVIADFALLLNLIILMAGMALLKATLTLPGIAGVILIIGMAVDANVLIFERMREELRSRRSKTLAGIVDRSYNRAFMTIFDSNLTTLMTAVVLFQFGTGPIKGFAVTLTMGIIISMFTALFVTRIVFDYIAVSGGKSATQTVPVGRFRIFQNANYDFNAMGIYSLIGSSTVVVAGLLSIMFHSGLNPGIDFAGGTLMSLSFKNPVTVEEVRSALPDRMKDSLIQRVISGEINKVNLRSKTFDQADADQMLVSLEQAMPDNRPEILSQRVVGPQVGEELFKQATWCIIFGSLLILLYVTLRFEFTFAVAALLALIHDVLITVTVFSILDKEFSLPIIAA